MSDAKPKQGAILTKSDFCGIQQATLEWHPGSGWRCPGCGTNVNGDEPRSDAE